MAVEFDRHAALELGQIQFDRLRRARQVGDAQDGGAFVFAQIGEDLAVLRIQQAIAAAAEHLVLAADGDGPAHPHQQRMRVGGLRFDVDGLIAVQRVHDRRQHQARRVGDAGEAAVAIGRPLHRRAHAVAVAEMDVVAHADFVAVIDDRRAGHRQQQVVHQLDTPPIMFQQRREAAADPEIQPGAAVGGVGLPQEIAFRLGDHLQRQLVVVAQEDRPLAVRRDVRRLAQDVGDREAVLARDRHVHARHQREVERHVAFVAVAEIILGILRPLVGLGQQHAVRIMLRRVRRGSASGRRGFRAGSRCWCPRVPPGTARRRGAGRRRRGPPRSAARTAPPAAPAGLSKFRSGW